MSTDVQDVPRSSPASAHRRSRWWRSVAVVVLLLAASGWINITLNGESAHSTIASSLLLRLDSALHQEGALQWRALAERGTPTKVAADVGHARAAEGAIVEELARRLPAEDVALLERQIHDYHAALDEELSLLALGRTDDALDFERQVTTPGFVTLSRWLQGRAATEAANAARLAALAHVLLGTTLAVVSLVIGLLVWNAERAHRLSAATGRRLLEAERDTVEQLRTSEAAVRHQAEHDPLTGLPNRLLFNRRLAGAAASDSSAVLFVDLDGFKAVNDRWGHAVGDELLIAVGERLRACARAEDVVARLGGDEFALLLVGADAAMTETVVRRIEAAMVPAVTIDDTQVRVGASVGVAFGEAGADPETLLTDADHRMYEQKRGVTSR